MSSTDVYQAFILWLTSGEPKTWEYTNILQQRLYVLCKFQTETEWKNNRLDNITLCWGITCRAAYDLFSVWRLTLCEYSGRHVLASNHPRHRIIDTQQAIFAHTSVCRSFWQTATGEWTFLAVYYLGPVRRLYSGQYTAEKRQREIPPGPVRWNVAKAMVGDQAWDDEAEEDEE